jgi:hypothetical protein
MEKERGGEWERGEREREILGKGWRGEREEENTLAHSKLL